MFHAKLFSSVLVCASLMPALGRAQVVPSEPAIRGAASTDVSSPEGARAASSAADAVRGALVSVHGVVGDEGGVHAFGARYHARLDARGFSFEPALAVRSASSRALDFELETIARGAHELRLDADAIAASSVARLDAHSASFDVAPGIAQRYEARADGLEHCFVFANRPQGAGDLVVRGRVAADFALRAHAHDGARFTDADGSGVSIGAVSGIDARGRLVAGSLALTPRADGAHELELRLPASFVDAAAYPLTLDPLIGSTLGVASGASVDRDANAAYDVTNDVYLVAWRRDLQNGDMSVLGQRVKSSGALQGGLVSIDTTSGAKGDVTVASCNKVDEFVVAWQGPVLFGAYVRARAVDAASGQPGGTFDIAAALQIAPTRIALSTESVVNQSEIVLAILDFNMNIVGVRLAPTSSSNLFIDGTFPIVSDGTAIDFAMSRSGGPSGRRLVVWTELGENGEDVRGNVYDRNGLPQLFTPFEIKDVLTSYPQLTCDGDGDRFALAYTKLYPSTPQPWESDVIVHKLDYANGHMALGAPLYLLSNSVVTDDDSPEIAWAGEKFLLAHRRAQEGSAKDDLVLDVLASTTCLKCGDTSTVVSSAPIGTLGLAPHYAGGLGNDDTALLTWTNEATYDVLAQRVEAIGAPGTSVSLGGGCGDGGAIGVTTNGLWIGNPYLTLSLSAPNVAASFAFLNLCAATTTPVTCGTCAWDPFQTTFSASVAGSFASKTVPVPCSSSLVGAKLHAQWTVGFTNTTGCALFPGFGISDRLELTIGQ